MCKSRVGNMKCVRALQNNFDNKIIRRHFWVWMKTGHYKQNKLPLS